MPKMGLVLQGGGALGAYEYGAVTRLVELGWQPVAVTGVSIGAITTAAIAGARNDDICASLRQLWEAITLKPVPFLPANSQAMFSLFGNPGFWRSRNDIFNLSHWTSLCDVSPMRETLETICDFDQLNDPFHIRVSVTATNVATGGQDSFSNFTPKSLSPDGAKSRLRPLRLTPDHILASGSLPPGFPMTMIDGTAYWDGGLFDNTPIEALLDLLYEDEIEQLPIFVLDLFANRDAIPQNLMEVRGRMMEISYENRFWASHPGTGLDHAALASMLEGIARDLPADSPVRSSESFRRLQRLRALKNVKVIQADHAPMTGGMDFSAEGVKTRFDSGYAAVDKLFGSENGRMRAAA
jgi:NTE family protein